MGKSVRPIGIHVRLYHGLSDIIQVVEQLQMKVVQSFLMNEALAYIAFDHSSIQAFLQAKKRYGFSYFVHAAYWSGLTDISSKMFVSLEQEVAMANRLQADGIVVHCGPKKGRSNVEQAKYVAESINALHALYTIKVLLENTPHAGKSFGGDLQDLSLVVQYVEKKELLGFCIDTAHAFVYGYDLFHEKGRSQFLAQLRDYITDKYLALLHLNDAQHHCGSYIDKHQIPGQGLIGHKALANIMNDSLLYQTPVILELPSLPLRSEQEMIALVSSW
ncbi:deoxyribonuclease IV [Candidatus Dependentiae bacterium]|nr:deoxyribonuclease IV [Candidatus Dependentiae bacterium]